jgi:hypothetical protein
MGSEAKLAAMQLHPLTPEAAGMLLKEPGLGRSVSPSYLGSRRALGVGQRLYFLEVPGARLQTTSATGAPVLRQSSGLGLALDFPEDQIRVFLYLSEDDAQALAAKLRQRLPVGGVMRSIVPLIGDGLHAALSRGTMSRLKIIHEGAAVRPSAATMLGWIPPILLEQLHGRLSLWIGGMLGQYFRDRAQDFIGATEDPADGVTLIFTFTSPPGLAVLRKLLNGAAVDLRGFRVPEGLPQMSAQAVAGYQSG